jgi:hypothetical protein
LSPPPSTSIWICVWPPLLTARRKPEPIRSKASSPLKFVNIDAENVS